MLRLARYTMLGEAYYILRHLLLRHLPGDELFVLGSILFSVAAFISALLAVSEEASTPSMLKVSP